MFDKKRMQLIKGYTKVFGQQNVCKEMMEELGVKVQFQLGDVKKNTAEETKNNYSTLESPQVTKSDFTNPYQQVVQLDTQEDDEFRNPIRMSNLSLGTDSMRPSSLSN